MNTIFMHNVDFKSDHKPYSIFEIYLVKYTNLFQSYTWPHFQFIVMLNLMFTMLSIQISYKYHIYAQCRL